MLILQTFFSCLKKYAKKDIIISLNDNHARVYAYIGNFLEGGKSPTLISADGNVIFTEFGIEPDSSVKGTFNGTFTEIIDIAPANVVKMMIAFRSFIGNNDMMAYLTMMCIRLIELRRVLKDTGSIYLHCDPTASHYLKILMDAIFDKRNYRNEEN